MNAQEKKSGTFALRVENLSKTYSTPGGPLQVLNDVSFELKPGESLAVVGPSGAGKSTLLNIIGSLDQPSSGRVFFGDDEVTALSGRRLAEFRSRRVGFVFQDHHLLPQCTALENVALPTLAPGVSGDGWERALDLIERVGLAGRMNAFPAQLSGGERQRVAIARAMVNRPPVLLCDEPTGNLDRKTGRRIAELFADLVREENIILLVVTHDLEMAGRFSTVFELADGELREMKIAQ